MPSTLLLLLWLLAAMVTSPMATAEYGIQLEHMASLKVPVYTKDGDPVYRFGQGAVNKISYDAGGKHIHYADARKPRGLRIMGRTSLTEMTFYDVEACGDHVIATYTSSNKSGVLIANAFNEATGFQVLKYQPVYDAGDPLSLQVTSDCQKVVITVDGKAFWDGVVFTDPRPAVVIVSIPAMLQREATDEEAVFVQDFKDLDERTEELMADGVRFPMEGKIGSFSQDLDPRDVTIDDITRKAYVTLQLNNAVVEVDLDSGNITRVTSLGLKDWRDLTIDVCDDDGVKFQRHPIYTFYQPGAISLARHSGATYLLTANTGAKRDYSHIIYWTEDRTGRDIVKENMVAGSVEPKLLNALANETQLGSLRFTIFNGYDDAKEKGMTRFIAFGSRSFSIRTLPDLDIVYDSGSDVEKRVAQNIGDVFNAQINRGPDILRYERDKTSVEKGPEPLSITSGRLGSLTLIFVGLARPGGVLVYSMPVGTEAPKFETFWISIEDALKSWDELYTEDTLAGIEVRTGTRNRDTRTLAPGGRCKERNSDDAKSSRK
ncbi:hypothetical protein BaRGS_00021573, partial [Batillaria attramentaria]